MGASEYAGLTAVSTGGASGVGPATARLLAARGFRVACLDLKPDDVPAPLAGMPADVADDAAVRAAVEEVARRLGGIGILVDNAGIGAAGADAAEDAIAYLASPLSGPTTGTDLPVDGSMHGLRIRPRADLPPETVRKEKQP